MTVYGKNRSRIYVLDQKIRSGGEGTVYSIAGYANLAAKIYRAERLSDPFRRKNAEEKVLAMLDMDFDPNVNGKPVIAWPVDAVYDSSDSFLGFVMPKIENMKSLVWAMRSSDRNVLWPDGYRWRYSIAAAFNLSLVIEKLHASGIIVGDMNTNNIFIDATGNVTLTDADSFNIVTGDNRIYKCTVGFPELLPPELQGKDLSCADNRFSEKTDCFALAIHIFALLNNNCHPFGCLNHHAGQASSAAPKIMDNIVNGYCPYVNGETDFAVDDALDMSVFPDEINDLFKRSFRYDAETALKQSTIAGRPSASEWRKTLADFYHSDFVSCSAYPLHEYPASYHRGCPWCAVESKKSRPPVSPVQPIQPIQLIQPIRPVQQTQPAHRTQSAEQAQRAQQIQPLQQTQPVQQVQPVQQTQPAQQVQQVQQAQPAPTNQVSIPVICCDRHGNTLHTSQAVIEYGKTGYAFAPDIQGYHCTDTKSRKKIRVNRKGKASQKEIRFTYKKDSAKKKAIYNFFLFVCSIAVLYCAVLNGMIIRAVHEGEYEKALKYMNIFPFYNELLPDEYSRVQQEVSIIEDQRSEKILKDSITLPFGITPEMTISEAHDRMLQAGFTLNYINNDGTYFYHPGKITGWYMTNFSVLHKDSDRMYVTFFFSDKSIGDEIAFSGAYRRIRASLIKSHGQPSAENSFRENWKSSNSRFRILLSQESNTFSVTYSYNYQMN